MVRGYENTQPEPKYCHKWQNNIDSDIQFYAAVCSVTCAGAKHCLPVPCSAAATRTQSNTHTTVVSSMHHQHACHCECCASADAGAHQVLTHRDEDESTHWRPVRGHSLQSVPDPHHNSLDARRASSTLCKLPNCLKQTYERGNTQGGRAQQGRELNMFPATCSLRPRSRGCRCCCCRSTPVMDAWRKKKPKVLVKRNMCIAQNCSAGSNTVQGHMPTVTHCSVLSCPDAAVTACWCKVHNSVVMDKPSVKHLL